LRRVAARSHRFRCPDRLWLLELGIPLGPDYDDVKAVYPSVGAGEKDGQTQRVEELKSLLARIPKVRLVILDGIFSHLRR
jgi:hypothetical protein